MPDIFHVITDQGVGGAGIFLSHLLADQVNRTGSLVLLPTGSLLLSRLREAGISVAALPLSGERSFSPRDTRLFRAFFKAHRPRLLVTHASLSARIAAKELKIPTLSVRHCDTPVRTLGVPLYNAVTDATVATSPPLAIRMRRAGIKNVFMIENGTTHVGEATKEERQAARAAYGIPESTLAVGLVGRLAPIKGHECALRALAALGEEKQKYLLCFLGDGVEKERLCALARALDLSDRVRFYGYASDVRPFFHALDAHLSCSYGSETSSLSLAEGLTAHLPTFASDTDGNRERLGAGGRLFPVKDASALGRLLLSLQNGDEKSRLCAMARARASCLPVWERTREEYAKLFRAFCGELVANGCFFRKDMLS